MCFKSSHHVEGGWRLIFKVQEARTAFNFHGPGGVDLGGSPVPPPAVNSGRSLIIIVISIYRSIIVCMKY